ncbi:sugar ABC transporter permease [Tengunoibacter tsumagoiensis]|uniref:Xylose transport system permease protein XylH n=1 Tax=Tengunoibacter tsumagoiensis TaxID=2014871 RepID=A0A402AB56_9CHLR|nr:inner-membrane translocator [Tengunoibacter tsumagoiensis]GCE16191.1 ABC transporter permease [Tengunoibacter tsumagoiensis]
MSNTIEGKEPNTELAVESHPESSNAVEVSSYRPKQTFGQLLRNDLGFLPVLLTLIAIIIFFTVVSNGVFLHPENFSNLINQIPTIGTLGLGIILVLLLGEVDLSSAAVSVLCAVVMGILSERMGMPGWVAMLAALLTGALVGAINGFFIAVLRIPSFIVTLASSIAYSGLLLKLLNGQSTLIIRDPLIVSLAGTSKSFLPDIYGVGLPTLVVLLYIGSLFLNYTRRKKAGLRTPSIVQLTLISIAVIALVGGAVALFQSYLGVPYSTAILFGLIILVWLMLTKTSFGRHIYATGGNNEAARRAGINVIFIRIAVFTLASTLAAAGGILAASHALSVQSQVDSSLQLDVIAAAVIGGVSLFGGRGSAWAIVLGMMIIGSLENGLSLQSQTADVKQIIEGIVLLLAVTADAVVRRLQARSRSGR